MIQGDFAARATATVQLKDMNNALDAASGAGALKLPVAVSGHEGSTVIVVLNGLRLLGCSAPDRM